MENQRNTLNNTETWKLMNIHWCSSTTDCIINFSIPKLCENYPFHNSNVNHVDRNYYQVTLTFMENPWNSLNNTENMKVDKQIAPINSPYLNCVKTVLSIHNSNVTDGIRNNYQVILTIMENQGNSPNNTENMKVDEHKLLLIKNR